MTKEEIGWDHRAGSPRVVEKRPPSEGYSLINDLTISLSYIQSESHKNLTGDDDHSAFTTRKKELVEVCCLILHIIFQVARNPW